MRIFTNTLLIFIVLGMGVPVFATQRGNTAQEAKAAFKEGSELFENGKYEKAAAAFRKANDLRPNWKLLYNIGQSDAAAKNYGLALEAFEEYLTKGGDDVPENRKEEVLNEVRRLRQMVGYIQVTAPDGAEIRINDITRGTAPVTAEIPVSAGVEHSIIAVKEGETFPYQTVVVRGSKTVEVTFEKKIQEETSVATNEPQQSTEPQKRNPFKIGGWASIGVGSAMLITGGITGGMALSLDKDLDAVCENGCPDNKKDDMKKMDTLATTSTVMLAVGGAVAVTGVVLLIVSAKKEKADSPPLVLNPMVGPNFAGAGITGRF